jgi:hypothetical protein
MRKKSEFERALQVTLYRIACASPRQARAMQYRESRGSDVTARGLTTDWNTPEAAIVWAIYERAVYDNFGIGTGSHGFGVNPVHRNETVKTGEITLSTGKRVNILELLGIDPEWAVEQLQKAINYTKLKEAA